MAKKNSKTERKPPSPNPAVMQEETAYLVREDVDEQQEPPRKTAAVLRTSAPTAPAGQPPAPVKVPSKPLAPLAALWPDPAPSKGESRPSKSPAPQKAPVAAIAPKPAPAPAAPLPPPVQLPPAKSPEKAPVATPTAKPIAPKTLCISFALHKPDAKGVWVANSNSQLSERG